jgi:hyperosmotically inducible protein
MNPKMMIQSIAVSGLLICGTQAYADDFEGDARDAWITGKVETVLLLNTHLNNFSIDTDTENGVVTLSGSVESDIDRELAVSLAEGVDGVDDVRDQLTIDAEGARVARDDSDSEAEREGRTFGTWVDDATTTAAVKSKLVANSETEGFEIDVDTHEDVVTLSGRVQSEQVKELAASIAMNTGDVRDVHNNLVVDPE